MTWWGWLIVAGGSVAFIGFLVYLYVAVTMFRRFMDKM